jgi:hypothetical protein
VSPVDLVALSLGAAWASGLNIYASVFVLGLLGATGNIALPPDLQVLTNPLLMAAAGFMYVVEFFADKTPGVDTGWDALQTFVRIPAGAVLAAGAVGEVGTAAQLAAALVGGSLTAATHATKAGTRVVINTSPEPFSNWAASFTEDLAVIGGVWTALHHPWLFLALLAVFVAVMAWALPRLWRAVRAVARRIARLFGRGEGGDAPSAQSSPRTTGDPSGKVQPTPPVPAADHSLLGRNDLP